MSFANRLKEARKKVGFTQKQLADKLKITPAMIAQYETGKRKPRMDTLNKIADILKLGYNYAPNGEPYFFCSVDSKTEKEYAENELFNKSQYDDAISSNKTKKIIRVYHSHPKNTFEKVELNKPNFTHQSDLLLDRMKTEIELRAFEEQNKPTDDELSIMYKNAVISLMNDMKHSGEAEILKYTKYIHSQPEYRKDTE